MPQVWDKWNVWEFEIIKRWIIKLQHRQTTVQSFRILYERWMWWWSVTPASTSAMTASCFDSSTECLSRVLCLSIAASVPARTHPKRRSFKSDLHPEKSHLKNKRLSRWSVRSTNLRYWLQLPQKISYFLKLKSDIFCFLLTWKSSVLLSSQLYVVAIVL